MFLTINLFIRRSKSEVFIIKNNYLKNSQKYFYTQIIVEMFELKMKFLFYDT